MHIVGERPGYMKAALLIREMQRYSLESDQLIVHSGQNYDDEISKSFFNNLRLPEPDIYF